MAVPVTIQLFHAYLAAGERTANKYKGLALEIYPGPPLIGLPLHGRKKKRSFKAYARSWQVHSFLSLEFEHLVPY
jgi:hypothetical protein